MLFRSCPDLAVYLRKGGYLSHIINWKAKYYFYFDEQGELIESLIDGEYRQYHQSKLVTTCSKNLCKSQEFEFLSLPKTNLQTGDVIFSANLYPYSGRGLSPITHIEIVSGIKNGSPMVLTNDISAPLKNLPLESTSTNRFTYLVARNQDFAQVFGDFIRNTTDSQALPVPYFCTNLYVEMYAKLFPEKTRKWDQVDRNSAEQIFLNTISDFKIVEMEIGRAHV